MRDGVVKTYTVDQCYSTMSIAINHAVTSGSTDYSFACLTLVCQDGIYIPSKIVI